MSRFVDRGAVSAGWIGLGTAVIVVVAFGLVLPIQPIVYLAALPVGLLMGWYANVRAERQRPRGRVLANAAWAGLLTALTLAIFYVGVRLLFVYADNGYPDFNRTDINGQPIPPYCVTGPDCTYQRHLLEKEGPQMAQAGITDGASFGRSFVAEQIGGGVALFGLALGGAIAAGALQAVRPVRLEPEPAI